MHDHRQCSSATQSRRSSLLVSSLSVLLALMLCIGAAQAKDLSSDLPKLDAQFRKLFDAGQCDKALPIALNALDTRIRSHAKMDSAFAYNLGYLGRIYDALGQPKSAMYSAAKALEAFRVLKDRKGEALGLRTTANAYQKMKLPGKAIEIHRRSLAIFRSIGDRSGEIGEWLNLSDCYDDLKQYPLKVDALTKAAGLAHEVGDDASEAGCRYRLACAYGAMSDYAKASEYFRQAADLRHTEGNKIAEADSLLYLGVCLDLVGRRGDAITACEKALTISHDTNDKESESNCLFRLGVLLHTSEQYDKARQYYEQALPLFKELEKHVEVARTLCNLGACYRSLNQVDKVLSIYDEALDVLRSSPDPKLKADTLRNMAIALDAKGQNDKSIAAYEQALAAYRECKDRSGERAVLTDLGDEYRSGKQYDKAIESHNQALAMVRESKDAASEADLLCDLGSDSKAVEKQDDALRYYRQAADIYRQLRDFENELSVLTDVGNLLLNAKRYGELPECFVRGIEVCRAKGWQDKELMFRLFDGAYEMWRGHYTESANLLAGIYPQFIHLGLSDKDLLVMSSTIAEDYMRTGKYHDAIVYGEQALALSRKVGNQDQAITSLDDLIEICRMSSQYAKAMDYADQQLALAREMKSDQYVCRALLNRGAVCGDLGQTQEKISLCNQVLELARTTKDRSSERDAMCWLGDAYTGLGAYQKASELYESAVRIMRQDNDKYGLAFALGDLAWDYAGLGRYQESVALGEEALEYAHAADLGVRDMANTQSALAIICGCVGQYDKSLAYCQQVLHAYQGTDTPGDESVALERLGSAYAYLGQYRRAVGCIARSLAIRRQLKDDLGHAASSIIMAEVLRSAHRYDEAIVYAAEARAVFAEKKASDWEGRAILTLGAMYADKGECDKALSLLMESESVRTERGQPSAAMDMNAILGEVYRKRGEYGKATDHLMQSLAYCRQAKALGDEAKILGELMLVWQKRNVPQLAILFGKQAVNILQNLRGGIQGMDKNLRVSFVHKNEDTYRTLADLLISQGRVPEAQQVLDLLKEEEYLSFVRRDSQEVASARAGVALSAKEDEWAKQYEQVAAQVTAKGVEYSALLDMKQRSPEQEQQLNKLESDLNSATKAFQDYLDKLQSEFAKTSDVSDQLTKIRESQVLMDALREIGGGAVVLHCLVSDKKYYVILTTPDAQKVASFDIDAAELNKKVLEFRQALQDPSVDPRPLAGELYKIVVGPIETDLKSAGAQTLAWSLDGSLRYVPIAALYDGKQYMVEKYRCVVFTPASETSLKDIPKASWEGLGLGVSKSREGFKALPGVAEELNGIIKPEDGSASTGVVPGSILLDDTFTADSMRAALRQRYPLVHIASHFQFNPGDETNSFLLMGDGKLTLEQIRKEYPVFRGLDLLTLSACNTAAGSKDADGREVSSFAELAQKQGAKSVIASLWPVSDESTQMLMRDFYRKRQSGGLGKAEALRQAQLELLHGELGGQTSGQKRAEAEEMRGDKLDLPAFKPDPKAPYAHPYYWAPFILIGNWK